MNATFSYWLDKSCYQPFYEIGREDLLFGVLKNGRDSAYVSPELKKEYWNDGIEVVSSLDSPLIGSRVMDNTSTDEDQRITLKVRTVDLIGTDVRSSLPQEFQSKALSEADCEGVYLNLYQNMITLTNDSRLIKKIRNSGSSTPCFRPSQILAANVLKGILSKTEAEYIWQTWKIKDPRWILYPKNFSDLYQGLDGNLLRKYFEIN